MAKITEVVDEQLLKMMQAGNEEAFTALYRRRQGNIYRYALAMSGSTFVAEEVTQDVFTALIQDSHGFDPARGRLVPYLLGMACHFVRRSLKHSQSCVSIEGDQGEDEGRAPVSSEDPSAEMTRRESIQTVHEAVLSLPEHYREAVVLCDLNEMSYDEAAAALGCSVGTVRSRLHRARRMLIEKLSGGKKVKAPYKTYDLAGA